MKKPNALVRRVALLRAVNVGGTGKLPMADLKSLCEAAGLIDVRTYITSGNVVFSTALSEAAVKKTLEARLSVYAGKSVQVFIRTANELARVLADNPFAGMPGNRVTALFLDAPPPGDALTEAKNLRGERLAIGKREIYIAYDESMADSRLVIPAAAKGTARNMNTVAKLAAMAGG
jgi:uncharacterized protein (DUF1697 family)